ncbi:MAG: M48 family metalloprotease [Pseudomonadota bacterium]
MIRLILAFTLSIAAALPASAQGLIRDAEIEGTLKMLSLPIYKAAGVNPNSISMYIVNDRSLNAFVAGGRNIFMNTGLIIELAEPAELQGVIAHELGHITGGHLARRNIKLRNAQGPALLGLLAGIAVGAAGGGAAGAAIAAGSQGAVIRDVLRHTRSEEASADQAALTYLDRANIDPSGLQRVFERFRGQEVFAVGNIDPYIITHPLSSQRMQLIERRVDEIGVDGRAPPPEHTYWHSRMRAKLDGFLSNPKRVLERLEDEPEDEMSLYAKSVALHRIPSPREAVNAIDRLIALRPNDPYYIELKGQILFESGRATEAVPLYRRAVELAPNQPLLKAGLGRALLALNDRVADSEALNVLQDARRADMADSAALRDLATAYSRAGDYGMASLATAERFALQGRTDDALLQARRASSILPEGSPGWLRAQDILSLAPEE